jgi:ubiquinone biosynthesis UbiH/UbiF/VisC/COQ6 family hydroxylase
MSPTFDVIIVGGGPAGLSFARALAHNGLKIAVVEKQSAETLANPPEDGRDIALTHHSIKLMKDLGAWARLPAEAISVVKEARVENGTSSYFLQFDYKETKKDMLGYIVPNYLIRKSFYEEVCACPDVTIMCAAAVKCVSTDKAGASVTPENGEELKCTLLAAADSRFSNLRRQMGIAASMKDFGRTCIVTNMTHELSHGDIAVECFSYGNTLAVLPLHGNRSSIVITIDASKAGAILDMDEKAFSRYVENRFSSRLGKMELVSERHTYPLVGVYSDHFVANRFALVGDAAVGMHPVTAHGFNLGLRGAATLAAGILKAHAGGRDIASPGVLEAYHRTHNRVAWPLYNGTNALVGLYTSEGPAARLAREAMLRLGNRIGPLRRAIMNQLTESHI